MAIKTNELPYQTYERITGKKWGSDPSAYKTYGVTAPAGSAAANLQLQSKLLSTPEARPVLNPNPTSPAPTANPASAAPTQAQWDGMGKTGVAPFSTAAGSTPATPSFSLPEESAVDKATREYYEALPRETKESDREAIREAIRKQMQNQVDAINNVYDGMVTTAKDEGEDRLGQTRAISSRSGLLGMPMGEAQKAKTEGYNQKVITAINNERNEKIAAIWSEIDRRADDRFEKEKTQALTNAKDYIDYLKTNQDTARTDMANLAKTGVDLNSLNEEDYKKLLDQTGYSPLVFKSLWNANLPSQQKRDYNYVNMGGGKIAVFSVNPGTNKIEKEEFSFDLQPEQEIREFDGMPYIVNKGKDGKYTLENLENYDYGANNKKNLMELRGGLYDIKNNKWVVAPKADSGGSSDKLTTDELKMIANQKIAPQLDSVKGEDGYISPSDYRKARNSYTATGLSAADFDEAFAGYANPNTLEEYDFVGKKLKGDE